MKLDDMLNKHVEFCLKIIMDEKRSLQLRDRVKGMFIKWLNELVEMTSQTTINRELANALRKKMINDIQSKDK